MSSRPLPFAAAAVLLLSSCVTVGTGAESPVLHGMAACAGDFCAPGVDDIEQGTSLFEQLGRDAEKVREHLLNVSDRSKLFGPDIRRLQRMFDGFQQIKAEGLERLRRRDRAGAWARLNPNGKPRQARRIVLNLADSSVALSELRAQFRNYPMPNLDEVIVITREGELIHLWP